MQSRAQALFGATLFSLTIGLATASARVGPDEEVTPYSPSAGGGAGSASSGAGHDADKGGFVLTSSDGDYKLMIGGLLQARFDGIDWDESLDRSSTATFQIRRARLYLIGHILGEKNRYFVEFGSDAPNAYTRYRRDDQRDFQLYDAWIKHEHSDALGIKIGQFRVPFGRQNLILPGKLQLPDRALAVERLDQGIRDLGIAGSGGFEEGLIQYAVAITNGDGANTMNPDSRLAFYGRLVVNPHGDYGYSEGDTTGSDELSSTFGIALHSTQDRTGENKIDTFRLAVEGGVKKSGFGIQGEYFYGDNDESGVGSFKTSSYYIQGGYFVTEAIELAARGSGVYRDGDSNDETEFSLGVNFLQSGHRLKWQAAYSYLTMQAAEQDDRKNHRFVAQAQLWF